MSTTGPDQVPTATRHVPVSQPASPKPDDVVRAESLRARAEADNEALRAELARVKREKPSVWARIAQLLARGAKPSPVHSGRDQAAATQSGPKSRTRATAARPSMTARLGSWHRALITWEQSRFTVVQQAYQARESRLERLRGPFVKPLQMPFALHVLKPRWVLYGVGYSLNCVFVLVFWWAKRVWWCPVPRPGLAERYLQATRMLRAENFDRTLFVSVMSLKGGIGKTTLTLLLAIFLRRKRTELVTVVQDCNEDDGTLGDRIRRTTRLSMRDAVKALSSIKRLPDLMRFCNRTKSGVLVLAMNGPVDDTDEAASAWRVSREELEDLHTRHEALTSVVVCDLGTNTTSPSNLAAMARTEQVVIPTTPARDSVTQALKTFNFMLNSNRHDQRLAARAIIVINLWSPLWMPFVSPSRIRKRFVDKYGEERLSGVTFVTVSMVVWLALGLHITPRVLLPRQRVQFSELCAMIAHGANSFNQDNPSSS